MRLFTILEKRTCFLGMIVIFALAACIPRSEVDRTANVASELDLACKSGDAESCYTLAIMQTLDIETALPLLEKACDGDSVRACLKLAGTYSRGSTNGSISIDIEKSEKYAAQALQIYKDECALGNGGSCVQVSTRYRKQARKTPSEATDELIASYQSKALEAFKLGCEADNGGDCLSYGDGLFLEPNKDIDAGLAALQKACDLGLQHCTGIGGKIKTHAASIDNISQIAERLHQDCMSKTGFFSCRMLGYEDKGGVLEDFEGAPAFYKKHCNAKDGGGACNALGTFYLFGWHVEEDYDEARRVFEKGCKYRHAASCQSVSFMVQASIGDYSDFKGMNSKDFKKALNTRMLNRMKETLKYAKLACKYGKRKACKTAESISEHIKSMRNEPK